MKAKAFLVASLKMSSTFSWYLAEHSRYRSAFICCRVSSPCDQRETTSSRDCTYLLLRQAVVLVSGLHASAYTDLYLDAHTFCHTCVYVMGSWLRALSFLVHSLSFLRSVLQPIRMTGISLQKCLTSGNHWKREKKFTVSVSPSSLPPGCWAPWLLSWTSLFHCANPFCTNRGVNVRSVVRVNHSQKNAARPLDCINHSPAQFDLQVKLCVCSYRVALEAATFIRTLSKLVGLVTSKQTRTMLASWYESGRSRS